MEMVRLYTERNKRFVQSLVVLLAKTMVELRDLLQNCPPEANNLLTTSLVQTEEALPNILYSPRLEGSVRKQKKAIRSFTVEKLKGCVVQLKSQLDNLLKVKEQTQRLAFAASGEAAEAA